MSKPIRKIDSIQGKYYTWNQINTRMYYIGGYSIKTIVRVMNILAEEATEKSYAFTWNEINEILYRRGWGVESLVNLLVYFNKRHDGEVYLNDDGEEFYA